MKQRTTPFHRYSPSPSPTQRETGLSSTMAHRTLRHWLTRASAGFILGWSLGTRADDWSWRTAFLETPENGSSRIRLLRDGPSPGNSTNTFRVVVANAWPAGLVPLFEVERDGQFELRRRPPAGRENTTDPLFFALPTSDDLAAADLAGRWQIQSTNSQGGRNWTFVELTAQNAIVAGRFDPNTDYRFAFLTGGTWRTNTFQVSVEYIQNHYELTADWRQGKLIGTWQNSDGSERGQWTGIRSFASPALPAGQPTTTLQELRRVTDGMIRYRLSANPNDVGEFRTLTNLCRVWLP